MNRATFTGDDGQEYTTMTTPKARLDTDRTAQPLTEIRAVHTAGHCVQPGVNAKAYKVVDRSRVTRIRVVISDQGSNIGYRLFDHVYSTEAKDAQATCAAIGELLRDFPEGEMKITRG